MLGMFNTEEAAKILGLKVSTLKTYRSRGEGPEFTKNGTKVFYSRDDIVEYLLDERISANALAYAAADLAEEYKADLAEAIDALMKDAEADLDAEIAKGLAEAGATLEDDTGREIAEAVRKNWRETFEEEFVNGANGGDEFVEGWNERYKAHVREEVEEDVDRAIDLL